MKTRNCSIDIFRYLCAILIVAIHTSLFSDVNKTLSFVFVQIIPRIAVPFFFIVSGYYYFTKLENNQKPFIPYIKKLIPTYLIWSCIYFIADFVQWGHTGIKGFIVNCIYTFFFKGSYYHLWFFVALILCVCLSTLMFKLKMQKAIIPLAMILYLIGCLGCAYYELGIKISLLNTLINAEFFYDLRHFPLLSFPFFAAGYLVYKIKNKYSKISNSALILTLVTAVLVWIAEVAVVISLDLQRDIVMTLGLLPLVVVIFIFLLNNPLPKYKLLSEKCRVLANFTYYSHPLFIVIFNSFNISESVMFVVVVTITFVLGIVITKLNKPILNKLIY